MDLGAADVWGALSGGSQRADRSLSAGPDTQDALRDVGYSENGFESIDNRTATLTTTTTTTTPGNTQQPDGVSQLSAAHHPRTSEGEGSQQRKTVTFSLEPEERGVGAEPQPEPQPEPEPQLEDDEVEDEEDDDEEILATQAWDPAAADDEEEEEEEDDEDDRMDEDDFGYAGGTQAAPPESPVTYAHPSSGTSPRPGLLRIREKPAAPHARDGPAVGEPVLASPYASAPARDKRRRRRRRPRGLGANHPSHGAADWRTRVHARCHRLVRPEHVREYGTCGRGRDAVDD